jgi:hypothetical protein
MSFRFQIRSSGSLTKYSACTLLMMNELLRFWPNRKCHAHQLIMVRPRRLRCTTTSAALSSGMFTHNEPVGDSASMHPSSQSNVNRSYSARGMPSCHCVVGHVPVERRVGEDQVHRAPVGNARQHVPAVAHVHPGVRIGRRVRRFDVRCDLRLVCFDGIAVEPDVGVHHQAGLAALHLGGAFRHRVPARPVEFGVLVFRHDGG